MNKQLLKEVANKLYPINNTGSMFMANREEVNNSYRQEGFIEGARWQAEQFFKDDTIQTLEKGITILLKRQERMYSEEEVFKILENFNQNMLFKYRISLEIEVEFDVPLLGTDTTKVKRATTDRIAREALRELLNHKTTSYVNVNRDIDEDNLKGSIKGEVSLRTKQKE
jgi:hypothetical protein